MLNILSEPPNFHSERMLWQMELDFIVPEIDFFIKIITQKSTSYAAEPDDQVVEKLVQQLRASKELVIKLASQVHHLNQRLTHDSAQADEWDEELIQSHKHLRTEMHQFEQDYYKLKQTVRAYVASYNDFP